MSRSYVEVKGEHHRVKTRHKMKDRKTFVYSGDHWSTKSSGGPGNKRAWKAPMPKWLYKRRKEEAKIVVE